MKQLKVVPVVCAMLALSAPVAPAYAQQYPTAPVRVLCGFAPGGSTDAAARLASKWLSQALKQSFVVENKVGANGLVSIQTLKSSKADGYTLMMASGGSMTITPAVKRNAGYKPLEDFTPIAIVGSYPYALVARPSFPANDIAGLVKYAKQHPGEVSYGSAGIGSTNHLAGEWFARLNGISLNHVAYKGDSPAVTDLLADRLDVFFMTPSVAMPHVKANKLKLLGSTALGVSPLIEGEKRMVSATVPGFEMGSWLGLVGPAGMAPAVVAKLNKVLNETMRTPEAKAEMLAAGLVPIIVTPEEFRTRIATELSRWTNIARTSKIEID
jgi:tripartite-type tricarboxylate transporter receptor subunit TctC